MQDVSRKSTYVVIQLALNTSVSPRNKHPFLNLPQNLHNPFCPALEFFLSLISCFPLLFVCFSVLFLTFVGGLLGKQTPAKEEKGSNNSIAHLLVASGEEKKKK